MALFIPHCLSENCLPYSHHLVLSMSRPIRTVKTLMHQSLLATIVTIPFTL